MIKQLSLLVMTLVFVMIVGCNFKELNNQWTDKPIKIDGNYSDWEGINLQYFEHLNLVIGSVNDAENLYLMFRFTDQKLARRIQKMSIICWLDENGKKHKKYGVQYSGSVNLFLESVPEIETSQIMSSEMMGRTNRMKKRLSIPDAGKIVVIKDGEKSEMAENQIHGPSAGSANHNGVFCFEFRIPIPISAEPGDKVSVCMELGGISSGDINQHQEQRDDSRERGRKMGGGQGMRGGRGLGGRRQRPRMQDSLEKQEIWMKLVLAGDE